MSSKKGICRTGARIVWLLILGACAASVPQLPYPAFIQVDKLPDIFFAGLPGVRAKRLVSDPQTDGSSNRITLPRDWQFTTGAAPGKSVEIFMLAGEIQLGDLTLSPGGYAYIPPGSSGLQMSTVNGAVLLYFLDEADPSAVIQTPLITTSEVLSWTPVSESPYDIGLSEKELRTDPGSGSRTWLQKIEPIATPSWQQSSVAREGYLISGSALHSECVDGEVSTAEYSTSGYFNRPAGAINGGPESVSVSGAVWLLRAKGHEEVQIVSGCVAMPEVE